MSQRHIEFTNNQKSNADDTASRILELLQQGAMDRSSLLRIHWRFSAAIGSLREQGHIIEMDRPNEENDIYYYLGCTPMVKVTKQMKLAYYETDHWRITRQLRLKRDHWKCFQCGLQVDLLVHHWTYNLFAEDVEKDVVTMCGICHEWLHETDNIRIHFPRYITQKIAERLLQCSPSPA